MNRLCLVLLAYAASGHDAQPLANITANLTESGNASKSLRGDTKAKVYGGFPWTGGFGSSPGTGSFPGTGGGASVGSGSSWGWGHGVSGETCCMCTRLNNGKTWLYAAGDYSHAYGSQTAHQHCNQVCSLQCQFKAGHKFGCFEEQQLQMLSQQYSSQNDFYILHEDHFGSLC
ncbi:unnamed protein product [Effrenium voratum]|nr:unnamed protein product [Effrenium voratum]